MQRKPRERRKPSPDDQVSEARILASLGKRPGRRLLPARAFVFLRKAGGSLAGRECTAPLHKHAYVSHIWRPHVGEPQTSQVLRPRSNTFTVFARPDLSHIHSRTTPRLNGKLRHRRPLLSPRGAWRPSPGNKGYQFRISSDCRDAPCHASVVAASARVMSRFSVCFDYGACARRSSGHRHPPVIAKILASRLASKSTAPPRRHGYSINFDSFRSHPTSGPSPKPIDSSLKVCKQTRIRGLPDQVRANHPPLSPWKAFDRLKAFIGKQRPRRVKRTSYS